jgi:hypothetical protein
VKVVFLLYYSRQNGKIKPLGLSGNRLTEKQNPYKIGLS